MPLKPHEVSWRRLEEAHDLLRRAMVNLSKTSESVPFSVDEEDLYSAIRLAWLQARRMKGLS
jgi:hypothetical protein